MDCIKSGHFLWTYQATHVARVDIPSSSSLSLSALNLVGASYELAASSRFRATNFFCYNVGVVLLHPGTGGHRLEALSMSDPSNSVAAAQT